VNGTWDGLVEVLDVKSLSIVAQWRFVGEMITAIHHCAKSNNWFFVHSPKATTDSLPPEADYFSIWSGAAPTGSPVLVRPGLLFIRASALHPTCEVIAVVHGAPPTSLAIIDPMTGSVLAERRIESGGTGSQLVWSPTGKQLVVIERDAARIYDRDLELLREYPLAYACSAAFSPNGKALAIGSWKNGTVLQIE